MLKEYEFESNCRMRKGGAWFGQVRFDEILGEV